MTVTILLTALLGAILGSFLNVVIIRWHEEASLSGRSKCPQCKRTIRPRHLIPVLSWILLRGRCADCSAQIHFQYPIIEASAALLAVIAAMRHDPFTDPWPFLFECIVTIGLLVPVTMDLRWKELPVEYLAGISIFAILFHTLSSPHILLESGVAILGLTSFFGLQVLLSRGRWLGEGDVWFGAMMGAILATPIRAALGVYLSYLVGGFIAVLGLLSGVVRRGSRVPFAPALAAGTLLTMWHGDRILTWIQSY